MVIIYVDICISTDNFIVEFDFIFLANFIIVPVVFGKVYSALIYWTIDVSSGLWKIT